MPPEHRWFAEAAVGIVGSDDSLEYLLISASGGSDDPKLVGVEDGAD